MDTATAQTPAHEPTGSRVAISLCDASQWPLRMTRPEVAAVCRKSLRTLFDWIRVGRIPGPDMDGTWPREVIQNYVLGGKREFEKRVKKTRAVARRH